MKIFMKKSRIHKIPKRFIFPFSFNKPISQDIMISQRTFDHYCNLTRSHCGEKDLKG